MQPDHTHPWLKLLLDLRQLYQEIDQITHTLTQIHGERLHCRPGCVSCCVDLLTVFEIEALNIRQNHPALLKNDRPRAPGACALLDEQDHCRIYADRPYVCRTQGLPLRWIEEPENGRIVEMRDICPLNESGPPIEELDPAACWAIGPFEEKLTNLQLQIDQGQLKRIALRDLFTIQAP
jgi:Fe-S-cluster containining protein